MMDNTPAQKCQKSPKNRHIRPPFSLFYLRKCLTNSGHYILSQDTEENSNATYSLQLQRSRQLKTIASYRNVLGKMMFSKIREHLDVNLYNAHW